MGSRTVRDARSVRRDGPEMLTLVTCPKCGQTVPEHRVGPEGCAVCDDHMAAELQADIAWREYVREMGD